MSTIRERVGRWLIGDVRRPPPVRVRGFDAAKSDEITFGFRATNSSIDQDLAGALDVLRGRSRNLAQNNDHARRYLQMVVANVVGPTGFALQCQSSEAGVLDGVANSLIEASFTEWARRGSCDVTGQLSFADVQALAIETVARDGECLVRRVRGRDASNRWNYALQVIDIDRLPTAMNMTKGDSIIVMGVELNRLGRPVAYHITPKHPGAGGWTAATVTERIPAEDIFHLYKPIRPEQRRGAPWMHTAVLRLEMLGKFEAAALIAARKGAETLGFFTSQNGDAPMFDAVNAAGESVNTSVPGTFDTLPAGYEFKPYESSYPNDVFGHFIMWSLRSIASGLGVTYTTLANDLTNVSYSSIRAGVLEERDMWMQTQSWMIEAFLRPVFIDWLGTSLLAGAITFPGGSALPPGKIDKFAAHTWQGRRWAWVDPLKDVNANIQAIRYGLKSRRDVVAEQGRDLEDVWAQIAAEEQLAESLGIDIGPADPTTPIPADMPA